MKLPIRFAFIPLLIISPTTADEAPHIAQSEINALIHAGKTQEVFGLTFERGDEVFGHTYTAEDGVGANIGNGQRFTLVPRADLAGDGEWKSHQPARFTGPNAEGCEICHAQPFGDGSGPAAMNNIRDPELSGDISKFINRNPPHVFGIGALQLLAEEITADLFAQRDAALKAAKDSGKAQSVALASKGTGFGVLTASPDGTLDLSRIDGIGPDLILRPLEWKGLTHSVRAFVRDAAHQEIGMQATEVVGSGMDGDGDGVADELSVGEITSLVIYQAAQPRPMTNAELSGLGLIDPLSEAELAQITIGEMAFGEMGCASCHTPEMTLTNSVFTEPSQFAPFRDASFPSGEDPLLHDLQAAVAVSFDLTKDLPDNIVERDGAETLHLGNFQKDAEGQTIVALYSDLKRHDMGPALAEAVPEKGVPAEVFLTQELWGVGSTAPYLHDGRATTLAEAIKFHGGEAELSRESFEMADEEQQAALIAFLENLVLFKTPEEEH